MINKVHIAINKSNLNANFLKFKYFHLKSYRKINKSKKDTLTYNAPKKLRPIISGLIANKRFYKIYIKIIGS